MGLNELAQKGTQIYTIASRCGVFAKTDVQALLNDGVSKADIALSILQAVVNQTTGNTRMEITSPVFDKVEFNLDSKYHQGKVFTIIAHNNNTNNLYIQKALLNGKEYNKCYLDFAEIAAGGTLELFMGDKPNTEWGVLSNI